MVQYTFAEYADMMLLYGEARCNGRAARRLYAERFPHRQTPSHSLFATVYRRASETGTFTTSRVDCGAPRRRRTPEVEEAVLHLVEEDATTSTRNIAGRLNVDHQTVWRVLHDQQLHPYHPQKVQAMQPQDFAPRAHFCRWFLHRCVDEPDFPRRILFTDEAKFTREGVLNSHNSHVWADENPHAVRPHGFQERYGLNIWAGFLDGRVIGPYLLPPRLTGAAYLRFLDGVLHGLLEDVPLNVRQNMWFQHDGAPPHFSLAVRDHLDERFGQQWIGRGGPIAWPARSPDLTPLDYYLWGHMKSLIYETPVASEEDLLARVMAAADAGGPGISDRVYRNMVRRYRICVDVGGRHMEPYL